jgi:hypothetical protein
VVNPVALGLSFVGIALMAVAYRNRENPAWRRDMRAIIVLAVGQVLLGTVLAVTDLLAR